MREVKGDKFQYRRHEDFQRQLLCGVKIVKLLSYVLHMFRTQTYCVARSK